MESDERVTAVIAENDKHIQCHKLDANLSSTLKMHGASTRLLVSKVVVKDITH